MLRIKRLVQNCRDPEVVGGHRARLRQRNLRVKVFKAQRLPSNLHLRDYKVFHLPRNLHLKARKARFCMLPMLQNNGLEARPFNCYLGIEKRKVPTPGSGLRG